MSLPFTPIFSEEAELGVCVQLLTHPQLVGDVNATCTPDDFWKLEWKETYKTILDALSTDSPLDVVIIADKTSLRLNLPDEAKADYRKRLLEGLQLIPVNGDPTLYSTLVREKSIHRQILAVSQRIDRKISEGISPNGEREELQELFDRLAVSHRGDWKRRLKSSPIRADELSDLVDEPVPYLVHPIIVRGSLTQIQGAPKGGKSSFCLSLAASITNNIWPQAEYISADAAMKVLYLAWEDPKIMMAKRLSLYTVGLGLDRKAFSPNLVFMFGPHIFLNEADQAELLKAAIRELGVDVVIIDTLSHAHSIESENDNAGMRIPMAKLMEIATELQVGILYAHHTGKGSAEKDIHEKGRGASSIAAAWHILIDWGRREKGTNVNPVNIQSKWAHHELDWEISYLPEKDEVTREVTAVKWAILPKADAPSNEPMPAYRKRVVLETINRLSIARPWSKVSEIATEAALGVNEKTVLRLCQTLLREGLVRSSIGEQDRALYFSRAEPAP